MTTYTHVLTIGDTTRGITLVSVRRQRAGRWVMHSYDGRRSVARSAVQQLNLDAEHPRAVVGEDDIPATLAARNLAGMCAI